MKNVVSYIRVSTVKQVQGHSLKYQKVAIGQYCKINRLHILQEYKDAGVSAFKERKQFERAFKRTLTDSAVTGIVVYDLTRFGRSDDELILNRKRLVEAKKAFYSVKENIDITTSEGKMHFDMISVFAEYHRNKIVEGISEGREYAKIHGTKSGKPMCRPTRVFDNEKIKYLRALGVSWAGIAKKFHTSPTTLLKWARKEGLLKKIEEE